MAGLNSAGIYGFARGMADAEKQANEAKAFETDQAIRTERLAQEKVQGPLRTRALEQEIGARERLAPLQEQAAQINVDTAKMTKEEKDLMFEDFKKARTEREHVLEGVKEFRMSGDPQSVVASLIKINPKFEGATATRDENGEITLNGPNNKPIKFGKSKWPDGSEMSPDDGLTLYAQKNLDPVKWAENEYQQRFGLAKEQVKQEGALKVAGVRAAGAEKAANAKDVRGQLNGLDRAVDAILKTKEVAGGMMAGFVNADDASLVGRIRTRASQMIKEEGLNRYEAAEAATNEVSELFGETKTQAMNAGTALVKEKIDPRDPAAVQAAAAAGNKNAKILQRSLGVAKREFGGRGESYLTDQLPRYKK